MTKFLVVTLALCGLVSCTDKTGNVDNNQFEGSFASQKKEKVTKASFWSSWSRDVMKEQVVLNVADGVYHEYRVTSEDGDDFELSEKIIRYKKLPDGSYEMLQVADACGEIKQNAVDQKKNTKNFKATTTEQTSKTVTGVTVKRISDEERRKLVSDIEKNKANDMYDLDCSKVWRWITN